MGFHGEKKEVGKEHYHYCFLAVVVVCNWISEYWIYDNGKNKICDQTKFRVDEKKKKDQPGNHKTTNFHFRQIIFLFVSDSDEIFNEISPP